mgnify:CR=1 FL=1
MAELMGSNNWTGQTHAGDDRRFAIRLLVVIASIVLAYALRPPGS